MKGQSLAYAIVGKTIVLKEKAEDITMYAAPPVPVQVEGTVVDGKSGDLSAIKAEYILVDF